MKAWRAQATEQVASVPESAVQPRAVRRVVRKRTSASWFKHTARVSVDAVCPSTRSMQISVFSRGRQRFACLLLQFVRERVGTELEGWPSPGASRHPLPEGAG